MISTELPWYRPGTYDQDLKILVFNDPDKVPGLHCRDKMQFFDIDWLTLIVYMSRRTP